MIDKSKTIEAIKKLEMALRSSGNKAADFFGNMATTINTETDSTKLQECLEQLCSSGAITQYSNFLYSEDVLFDAVYEEAKKLLQSIWENGFHQN